MKTRLFALVFLLSFMVAYAEPYLAVGEMYDLCNHAGTQDRYEAMSILTEQGCGILYFNDSHAILLINEQDHEQVFNYKNLDHHLKEGKLYLITKPSGDKPSVGDQDIRILHDLGSSYLVASDLGCDCMMKNLRCNCTPLDFEPMVFKERMYLPAYRSDHRTNIAQLVSLTSADSVLVSLQHLQDFQTRYALADNRLEVAEWIKGKFESYGISDVQLQSFDYQGVTQYNVVATIPGTAYPDEYIIVGGHHDSISSNSDPYTTAPGADDNASGTVAALEMARVIQLYGYQPLVSIRFVTFACEELGLWGSKHYSQNALDNEQNIRLMINHDMIANNTALADRPVKIMPYDGALDYADYAWQLTEQYTTLVPQYGNFNSGGTDSYPFWQKGYNVLFFNEAEFSPVYHSPEDVVSNLDPVYCAEVIRLSLACTVFFADIPGSPEAPEAAPATQITQDGFTANWVTVNHADRYLLEVYTKEPTEAATDLFFSEYIEGGGNNKAIEIYNGTGSEVDLSGYTVHIFSGAAITPTYVLNLSGSLFNGEVYVIVHPYASVEVLSVSDVQSQVAGFDGDDQLALYKESTNSYVDIIGRIGEDPGTGWGEYPLTTLNRTLVRKNWVNSGVSENPTSGFPTLESEWDSYLVNTTKYLGSHSTSSMCYLPGLHNLEVDGSDSWTVGNLESGHAYHYAVRAANDYFTSELSDEIMVRTLEEDSLPVELSSFTASITSQNLVNLVWTVQSETGMQGYYILRGSGDQLVNAVLISPVINAANSSEMHRYEFTDTELDEIGTYHYWLLALDMEGHGSYHGPVSVYFDASGESPAPELPLVTELKAIYPNPFNPTAFIPFSIAEQTDVQIMIFNSKGQFVRNYALGNYLPGNYRLIWDGTDFRGSNLSTGIYFITMKAENCIYQRKSLLLK